MRIRLRGQVWDLVRCKLPDGTDGLCEPPGRPGKRIKIRKDMGAKDELETLIHEMLHACYWDLDEKAVEEAARDIARALWRLGYRNHS